MRNRRKKVICCVCFASHWLQQQTSRLTKADINRRYYEKNMMGVRNGIFLSMFPSSTDEDEI
jgi:hypothetical protein